MKSALSNDITQYSEARDMLWTQGSSEHVNEFLRGISNQIPHSNLIKFSSESKTLLPILNDSYIRCESKRTQLIEKLL